jgi:branched-chain amino acid transport system ATP-binding protein
LDEPSLGLSPLLAQEVFSRLRGMKDTGMSMMVVEQNSSLAVGLADWVYVIRDGQVQLSCHAEEARQRESLIAEYLGIHTGGSQPV